jgi:hypothetical protein
MKREVLALEVALVLEFNLDLGWLLGSLGGGTQPVMPYLQLEASLHPCSLDLSVL